MKTIQQIRSIIKDVVRAVNHPCSFCFFKDSICSKRPCRYCIDFSVVELSND